METGNRKSINQLVGYNITRARQAVGITQEELGARLTAYTGRPWSKATVSAAERSVDGKRVRQFDADDLVAFAWALEVPLTWLVLPTGAEEPDAPCFTVGDGDGTPLTPRELLGHIFGAAEGGRFNRRYLMAGLHRTRVYGLHEQWGAAGALKGWVTEVAARLDVGDLRERAATLLHEIRQELARVESRSSEWSATLQDLEHVVAQSTAHDDNTGGKS